MRDMCRSFGPLGAWAAADNSGVDWQPVAAGFKGLLPHGESPEFRRDDVDGHH